MSRMWLPLVINRSKRHASILTNDAFRSSAIYAKQPTACRCHSPCSMRLLGCVRRRASEMYFLGASSLGDACDPLHAFDIAYKIFRRGKFEQASAAHFNSASSAATKFDRLLPMDRTHHGHQRGKLDPSSGSFATKGGRLWAL